MRASLRVSLWPKPLAGGTRYLCPTRQRLLSAARCAERLHPLGAGPSPIVSLFRSRSWRPCCGEAPNGGMLPYLRQITTVSTRIHQEVWGGKRWRPPICLRCGGRCGTAVQFAPSDASVARSGRIITIEVRIGKSDNRATSRPSAPVGAFIRDYDCSAPEWPSAHRSESPSQCAALWRGGLHSPCELSSLHWWRYTCWSGSRITNTQPASFAR
jgi:hypothetical protein